MFEVTSRLFVIVCMVQYYTGMALPSFLKDPVLAFLYSLEQRHRAANTILVVSTEYQSGILKMLFSCPEKTSIAFHLESIQRVFGREGNLELYNVIM